jgi:hypothetical protein
MNEQAKSNIPTAADVLRQQREQHGYIVPAKEALPTSGNGSHVTTYLDEHAGGGAGTLFKFAKDQRFRKVADDEEVPLGKEFIVIYDQIQVGWIKFAGKGEPPERRMGPLFAGFLPCPREALGDTDQSLWDAGLSGKPADPWQSQILLPLQAVDDADLYVFGTTSITGRRAVGRIIAECQKMQRREPDLYPIIKLALASFQHRDERVGRVTVPAFVQVGKTPKTGTAAIDTSVSADLNDEIGF